MLQRRTILCDLEECNMATATTPFNETQKVHASSTSKNVLEGVTCPHLHFSVTYTHTLQRAHSVK